MKKIVILFSVLCIVSAASADNKRATLLGDIFSGLKNEKFTFITKNDYKKIKRVKQGEFQIPKELRIKALLSLPVLTQEAKVIKTIGVGGIPGYLITYIQPGSVFRSLGLQVGDFLSKINNAPLTDAKQITKIFSDNKNIDKIVLGLYRKKIKLLFNYQFVDQLQ